MKVQIYLSDSLPQPGALDAPAQNREQQIAAITQQADAAATSALTGGDNEARPALVERLEQLAQRIEEEAGSPYLLLAAHIRRLIARLREGDGGDAPGGVG